MTQKNSKKEKKDEEKGESDSSEYDNWISWFCSQKGCEFFCEVDEEFIESNFNLYGLKKQVRHYKFALDTILEKDNGELENLSQEKQQEVNEDAIKLYGLIHARYIITKEGQERMKQLYSEGFFGRCPKVSCGAKVLPVGMHDIHGQSSVKVYCAACGEIYNPRSNRFRRIDGCYFGTTFPHLFFMQYPNLKPKKKTKEDIDKDKFIPKVFGFQLLPSAMGEEEKENNVNSKENKNNNNIVK